MSEPWAASMSGVPWNLEKMNSAVKQLRNRAAISFVVGTDETDDLLKLDERVFSKRPDLILHISNREDKGRYTEKFLTSLAGLKHVAALQLDLQQQQDLTLLSALNRMDFLNIRSQKPQNLDFIRHYKQLRYLSLSGKFEALEPIADCMRLDTLVLNCAIDQLDFVADLPLMEYLALDSCTLKGSLEVLADSNIRMLRLSTVRGLTNIDALGALHKLAYLHLSLPKVERLCDFSSMKDLRQLELDFMKSLKEINNLWTAQRLEVLDLKDIHTGLKAEAFGGLTEMCGLRQVDFRFIDPHKGRIAALRKRMYEAGKEQLLYENIPDEKRIPSMGLVHLSHILM
ncbi:hypothetical protein [Paenibacillus nasutitermitis]|uniref:Internalin A n=1 Tax=Paenibacillus nasutitermitis TaxID=1652958 RepID=A0A916Z9Z5_9BACL|nr:hypothetical protein [Paenibacillus nasutitermitis]GGD81997.1 hypothetical protein GCM10010911_45140 [Paenibacillus nasutitermitis]